MKHPVNKSLIDINDLIEAEYCTVDKDPTTGKFNIDNETKRKRFVIKRDPTSKASSQYVGKSYGT